MSDTLKKSDLDAVILIVGSPRSGSTLLARMLGQVDGCFCAGELRWFWWAAMQPEHRCGCGERLRDCDIWGTVLRRLAAKGMEPPEMWKLQLKVTRLRRAYLRAAVLLAREQSSAEMDYAAVLRGLVGEIADVTGASVVIDSSKAPDHAMLEAQMVDTLHVQVQLVRDPRGVVYSASRRSGRSGTLVALRRAASWVTDNTITALLRRSSGGRSILVRYEDLVTAPEATMGDVLSLAGMNAREWPVKNGAADFSAPVHTVHGNDNRFRTGLVPLRVDDAWQTELPGLQRALVSIVTAPGRRLWCS